MKETLKRELNRTYLILSSEETSYEETYEIEMIIKNEPQRILPLHVLRVDEHIQLFYEVSAKQTLKDCAQRNKLSAKTICALFETIGQLIGEVRNYLLDMECVMLDLEHIYTQEGTFYFCYCPWEKKDVMTAFREMLEEILGNLDYHDTEGVELAYHLYQSACKGNFCIDEILKEHCSEEKTETSQMFEEYFSEQENYEKAAEQEIKEKDMPKRKGLLGHLLKFFMNKEKTKEGKREISRYEETYSASLDDSKIAEESNYMRSYSGIEGNTMLLENMPAGQWKIRPLLPEYEEFYITGERFLVGKKKECVDGYIERDTISRIHSQLTVRNGELYIADVNSTNGTFVNGESIPPGEDVEIFPGDRILFADVEYECYNSL